MAPPGSRPAALGLPSPVSPGEGRRPGRRPWAKGRGAAAPRASSVVLCSPRVCGAVRGEGGGMAGGGVKRVALRYGEPPPARHRVEGGGKERGRGSYSGEKGKKAFGKRGAALGALLSVGCVWRERDLGLLGGGPCPCHPAQPRGSQHGCISWGMKTTPWPCNGARREPWC